MMDQKCYLNALGILCSAGNSPEAIKKSLLSQQCSMTITDEYSKGTPLPLGLYNRELPDIPLTENKWHSRNNQFALAAVNQIMEHIDAAIARFGIRRVGVVIGTSTSGIAESEPAIRQWVRTSNVPSYYDYCLQEMGATAQFIAMVLGVQGPAYCVSTACSSGAKALASARRLIRSGICDAVVAGGVDTLCQLTVHGFSSLEAVSSSTCNPFSRNRNGINIGEGAALFLITAEAEGVELSGVGESADAYHISAPDPSGSGAIRCMSTALKDGAVTPDEVGYVNLHGTATVLNDKMESHAVYEVFGSHTWCSSTKPYTGHTLGAAGAVEAGICWLALENKADPVLPVHIWDGVADPNLPKLRLVTSECRLDAEIRYVLSNTFAFGGNNISLLLGRIQ